jgi:hypothetical protein
MGVAHSMNVWPGIVGSLAMIAIIVTAFGLTMGIVKLSDALNRTGAIVGIVIALTLIPAMLVACWTCMSLWQQIGVAALGFGGWHLVRPGRHAGRNKDR